MPPITQIQKDIEANNIAMGRKLLAYDVMLRALEEIYLLLVGWQSALPDGDLRDAMIDRMAKVSQVLAKAEGETS